MEARPQEVTGLSAGACVPDTCDTKQLEWVFAKVVKTEVHMQGVEVGRVFCKQREEEDVAPGAGAAATITFLALWGLVVLTSTVFDSCCQKSAGQLQQPKPQPQAQEHAPSSSKRVRVQPGSEAQDRSQHLSEEQERNQPLGEQEPGQIQPRMKEEQRRNHPRREEMERIQPWRKEQGPNQPRREKKELNQPRREEQEPNQPCGEKQEPNQPWREEQKPNQPWREEQEPNQPRRKKQEQRRSPSHAAPGSVAVEVETDVDSNVPIMVERHQPPTRSILRLPQQQRHRHVRAILRGRLDRSLLRSAAVSERQEVSSLRRLAQCFSLRRNVQRLLDTSTSDTEISCLHGIRFLSLAWVVLVNSLMRQVLFTRNAVRLFTEWRRKSFLYPLIGNGNLSLDSLFALSGLLVGYACSLRLDKQVGKMKWGAYIFNRWWRIAPTLVMVAVVYISLFPYLTNGPLSLPKAPDQEACARWGWLNALLMQNLFAPSICMNWTWFLAVDFQLFLLTPVLLWLLYHRPRLAYLAVFLIVLASWVASGVLSQIHHLPVSQFILQDAGNLTHASSTNDSSRVLNVNDFTRLYLYQPWAHAGSFFLPLLLGYLLYSSSQRASFSARTVKAAWVTAVAVSAAVLLGVRKELVGNRTSNAGTAALYNAVQRTVWGLAVGWVVVACSTGHGGPVNSVLAWRGWKPLSRLAFAAYLLHPIVAMGFSCCLEQLVYMTDAVAVYQFLGVLVLSLLLSAVLTVTWEMPVTALPLWLSSCCVPFSR